MANVKAPASDKTHRDASYGSSDRPSGHNSESAEVLLYGSPTEQGACDDISIAGMDADIIRKANRSAK
jgi:hypothetical protein